VIRASLAATVLAALALAGPAPAQQAQQPKQLGSEDSPYVRLSAPRQWTLSFDVVLPARSTQPHRRLDFVLPLVVESSAASIMTESGAQGPQVVASASITIDDRDTPSERTIEGDVNNDPVVYGVWSTPDSAPQFEVADEVGFHAEANFTASRLDFDESRASRVEWPKGEWPAAALSALEPQFGIELTTRGAVPDTAVRALLQEATDGRDPKTLRPVPLAKWLAGKLIERVRVSAQGINSPDREVAIPGAGFASIRLQTVEQTVSSGEGSAFDMTNALVSLYRRAGIPARLVIAYDVGAENPAKRNRLFEGEERGASALRPYAEFALYDEETNSLAWIPVDIVAMSGRSSRLPPNFLDRPQPYFGTNKELDSVIPIAFGYVPERATIGAEAPAFYGVRFDPPARLGMQSQIVTIGATRMVNRGRR